MESATVPDCPINRDPRAEGSFPEIKVASSLTFKAGRSPAKDPKYDPGSLSESNETLTSEITNKFARVQEGAFAALVAE